MFGTLFSNRDFVIAIHNHWVPLKKFLFGIHNLSEVWNPNLNFMWVPWQIWEQPRGCFWIQSEFESRLNFIWVPILLSLLDPLIFLHVFSFSPSDASLSLSLSLSHYRAPSLRLPTPTVHYSLLLPLQSPLFSLFITLGQTPTLLLIASPSFSINFCNNPLYY